ncbi:MAG: hypothetical protein MRZ79_05760 [Bacteroidia bacterium]|nr:hypothetical protein [Bacteroidia bacterium]
MTKIFTLGFSFVSFLFLSGCFNPITPIDEVGVIIDEAEANPDILKIGIPIGESGELIANITGRVNENSPIEMFWTSNLEGELYRQAITKTGRYNFTFTPKVRGIHKLQVWIVNDRNEFRRDSAFIPYTFTLYEPKVNLSAINLTWGKMHSPQFVKYEIRRKDADRFSSPNEIVATMTNVNDTSFSDKEIILDKNYLYQVVGFTGLEEEWVSNKITVTAGKGHEVKYKIRAFIADPTRNGVIGNVGWGDKSRVDPNGYGLIKVDLDNFSKPQRYFISREFLDMKLSPDGEILYLAERDKEHILLVNPNTMKTITVIPTEGVPHRFAVGHDHRLYYKAEFNYLKQNQRLYRIIDLNTRQVLPYQEANEWPQQSWGRIGDPYEIFALPGMPHIIVNKDGRSLLKIGVEADSFSYDKIVYDLQPFSRQRRIIYNEDGEQIYFGQSVFDHNLNHLSSFENYPISFSPDFKNFILVSDMNEYIWQIWNFEFQFLIREIRNDDFRSIQFVAHDKLLLIAKGDENPEIEKLFLYEL